ncbi:MAG: nucleotide exchange factor GrpE [Propionibacteriales bacterium]|nr:nucleotide exchange factor GrpE [Propionibacteriales bacterium]
MTDRPDEAREGQADGPVVRDRRRIDPVTGEAREPQPPAAASGPPVPGQPAGQPAADDTAPSSDLETALAERTVDLQRLQAEYVNYKRRVDRDRDAVREAAVGAVLAALLPVLDDIDRAREHGEVEGGFKAVADSFERSLTGLGLVRFGEVGDPFDPRIHEALMHAHAEDVDGPTCQAVLQAGYRIGERILRPARVAVVEPADAPVVPEDAETDPTEGTADGAD